MTPKTTALAGRVLVVAFEGWNDAGEAATTAVTALRDSYDAIELYSVDAEKYFDYQFNRPVQSQDESGRTVLTWPGVGIWGEELRQGRRLRPLPPTEPAVFVLLGTEPSRSWQEFTTEILGVARQLGITGIVFCGAMLADVPHSRPITVSSSSENAEVRNQFGIDRSGYEGPVGILSVLAHAADDAGIATMSIWASVPHYVHSAPSPKATLALLERLEEVLEVSIPHGDLAEESTTWEEGIDALAGDDEDMAAYIRQLEKARDTVDSPDASGEAIAEEFEKYLRHQGDDPRRGPAGAE